VVEQIRHDQIDILVDLAGHTGGNRLGVFAQRPAPVQVTYLGYPNTTGLAAIGYRLSDAVADPTQEPPDHCSEQIVRLPGCWCTWSPPANAPDVAPPPVRAKGHITFGSLHKPPKINDAMMDLWAKILHSVPGSRLLIFRNTLDISARERLTGEFRARGIASDRLDLNNGKVEESASHLTLYHRIDISLDSLPWSGHATTCESLWMGVPMVSLRGNRHAGRMSASIMTALNLTELIAETPEQYVQMASRLAADVGRLTELRAELRNRMKTSPLCDAATFTRQLEATYRDLWRRWCQSASDGA
jgi:predicted O-linked N-acetylglucosamine transferase (SPINDLY family)